MRLIVLLWLLLTLPMALFLGYGSDPDAWIMAHTGERMLEAGRYISSRTTGFPLMEGWMALAAWLGGGAALSNLLSVFSGVMLLLGLGQLARGGAFRHPLAVILTIALMPMMLKNGASSMDYLPAMALMTWAYAKLRDDQPYVAALLIGAACGFRPTSGLYALPAMAWILVQGGGFKLAMRVFLIAFFTGMAAFSPSLYTYGIPLSVTSDIPLAAKKLILIGGYHFLNFLGHAQSLIVWPLLAWLLWRRRAAGEKLSANPDVALHLTVIASWLLLYMLSPLEPEYLIPMLPSLIMLLDQLATGRAFVALCALLLFNHVGNIDTLGGVSGHRYVELSLKPGYLYRDIQDRRFKLSFRAAANAYHPQQPTLLMYGDLWMAPHNPAWRKHPDGDLKMLCQVDGKLCLRRPVQEREHFEKLKQMGYRMVLWSGRNWEYAATGNTIWREYVEVVDSLDDFFGRPIVGRPIQ
ncbi:putative inner membrane protein [Magnetofaba australis IT-1]|uniref:Putative inner membrane protein n=2 Tax=Magnetofaba TaxID=1472292 RepID=A0A1Y2JZE6_9PROT|nr:putative inner membrane protein [Magnetofaba australis IT-1]